MTVRIDRKNSSTATAVARTEEARPTSAPSRTTTNVENAFTGIAANDAEKLSPKAKTVSTSASPEALWGRMEHDQDFAMNFFAAAALQDGNKAQAVRAQMAEVQGKMGNRVNTLEGKWKNQRLDTRAQMLKKFAERKDVPAEDRAKIQSLVKKQDALQAKISSATEELKANYPPKTAAAAAARDEKLRALVELRKEQRALVYEAKAVVEKKPEQNVVLLAENEQKLDPNGARSEDALWSLLGKWLHLSSIVTFFSNFTAETAHKKSEQKRDETQEEIARIESNRKHRQTEGVLKQDWAVMRVGLKF